MLTSLGANQSIIDEYFNIFKKQNYKVEITKEADCGVATHYGPDSIAFTLYQG